MIIYSIKDLKALILHLDYPFKDNLVGYWDKELLVHC